MLQQARQEVEAAIQVSRQSQQQAQLAETFARDMAALQSAQAAQADPLLRTLNEARVENGR